MREQQLIEGACAALWAAYWANECAGEIHTGGLAQSYRDLSVALVDLGASLASARKQLHHDPPSPSLARDIFGRAQIVGWLRVTEEYGIVQRKSGLAHNSRAKSENVLSQALHELAPYLADMPDDDIAPERGDGSLSFHDRMTSAGFDMDEFPPPPTPGSLSFGEAIRQTLGRSDPADALAGEE